jgi:hypothetical protein
MLHQVLVQCGYYVDVEPPLADRLTSPDFFARRAEASIYLEATVATDLPDEERRRESARSRVYDMINAVDSPDFFIRVVKVEIPSGAADAPPRRVRAWLKQQLAERDWNEANTLYRTSHLDALPTHDFEDIGVKIRISFIPRSEAKRGQPGLRPIGLYPVVSRIGDVVTPLQSSLKSKSTKYGRLDAPFVIAVNSTSEWGTEVYEIEQALFGYEEVHVIDGGSHRLVRTGTGFFRPDGRSVNERVSAVLVGSVWPSSLDNVSLTLYHNPWAEKPLSRESLPFPQKLLVDNRFERIPGQKLNQILGLPTGWPNV